MDTILRIKTGSHFSFGECLWFLHRNFDECLYRVQDKSVTRAINLHGQKILFNLSFEGKSIIVKSSTKSMEPKVRDALLEYVNAWFDLGRNLEPFYRLLDSHPSLRYMAKAYHGLRMVGIPSLFEALCWCIIGQQINLKFAYKIKRRLVEKYGDYLDQQQGRYYLFPSPSSLAGLTMDELKSMQFSRQKADYIIHIAQLFSNGTISKDLVVKAPTKEAQLKILENVRGIGPWTANYALMKSLGNTSCIPVKDIGLLAGLEKHHLLKDRKDQHSIDAFFKHFEGWESYAVFYLWRSLAVKPE